MMIEKIRQLLSKDPVEVFNIYEIVTEKNLDLDIEKNKYDFFELAYQALQNNINPWQVGKILVKLILFSKYDKNNILNFLKLLYEKEKNTSIHFQITQQLTKMDKNLALNLLNEFLKIKEEFCIPHIGAILVELHNTYKINQFETILEYLDSKDEFKQKCIIGNIHLFDLSDDKIQIIFKKFNQLINQSPKIDMLIIYNSYDLIEKGYEYFSNILLKFIDIKNKDIKFVISQILMFGSEEYLEEDWFEKLFFSLLNNETSYLINNLDLILGSFLEKDKYQIVEKFLFDWSIKGDLTKVIDNLNHFIYKLNKSRYFSTFITKALNYENEKLHSVVSKMLKKPVELDKEILKEFDFDDYIYVIRKILGYFYEFETINRMIFSILKVENLSEDIKNVIKGVITNFIGKNYPYDTKQFYESLKDEELNKMEKEVKYFVLETLNQRIENYKKLPYLKELEPPKNQTKKIHRANNIVMNKIYEKSQKDSFIDLLFTKIPIRYGKGSFWEINGEISDISYMQAFESKVRVPIASQAYPIALELEMTMFRLAKKGNK